MKHKLFLLLAAIGILLPQVASAYDFEVDGIYYNISGNNVLVTSGSSRYTGSVVIPATVTYSDKTYSVTSIGNRAFENCTGLTSVTIPNSVTSIGVWAFGYCRGLTSITIPNSVTSIGTSAFEECRSVKELIYADGCTTALQTFLTSITSVKIPNSVTSIEGFAFYNCRSLTSVTIPNSVTSIGDRAFDNCMGLTSVSIPKSVISIGSDAFSDCTGLTSISVEYGNTHYDSRNDCNALIETSRNTLILGCKNTIIPEGVTSIGYRAFYYCTGLTSITIPNSVTSIESDAFYKCTDLEKVYTGKSVEIIPEYCFYKCTNLDTLIIGESTRQIEKNAFNGCERITQIHSHNYVPPTCATDFPEYVYKAAVVYVPNTRNAVARYQADNVWSKFFEIYDEDITGVEAASINTTVPTSFVNLNGQYITNAQRGINLQKMSDGTTKKVLMR